MRLGRLGLLCAIGALVVAGCGSGANTISTTSPLTALRFLNGSPDAGAIDVYLGAVSGTPTVSSLAYATLNTYANVNTQVYTVTVTRHGSTTASLSCVTPTLVQNTRYTIVIAGKVAGGTTVTGLQCQVFAETVYSLPVNQFQLAFHYASPALNATIPQTSGANTPIAFGLYSAGTANYQINAGAPATFSSTITSGSAVGTAVNVLLQGVQTAPGIGVYAAAQSPNPPATVYGTVTPSQATQGLSGATIGQDTTNTIPFFAPTPTPSPTVAPATPTPTPAATTAPTATSSVFSVYVIDGLTTTAQLVGALD